MGVVRYGDGSFSRTYAQLKEAMLQRAIKEHLTRFQVGTKRPTRSLRPTHTHVID